MGHRCEKSSRYASVNTAHSFSETDTRSNNGSHHNNYNDNRTRDSKGFVRDIYGSDKNNENYIENLNETDNRITMTKETKEGKKT